MFPFLQQISPSDRGRGDQRLKIKFNELFHYSVREPLTTDAERALPNNTNLPRSLCRGAEFLCPRLTVRRDWLDLGVTSAGGIVSFAADAFDIREDSEDAYEAPTVLERPAELD